MTIFLGLIAATLLIGIIVVAVVANRDDDVLAFTLPEDLQQAQEAASFTSPNLPASGIAPRPVIEPTIDDVIAERETQLAGRSSLADFYPGNLGVGTTLRYRGVDSIIFGVVSFDTEDFLWQDYFAEHAQGQWWRFGVEPDRGMKLAAFEPRQLGIEPGPDVVSYLDELYRVTEAGEANYRTAGQIQRTGLTSQSNQLGPGRYEYYDYENDTGVILSFERFDNGPWITSIGHHVDPNAVIVSNSLPDT